ncbi:AraC family transcriptional regulator [Streptomyces yaizuensis]|uniref:AraC family transcriptional regulator n=1 Tax=Streptomyces yaizuensis TaxID=2989713 RepID=A0ABQ5NRU5_9ACTN|nr:AraC family transcriptional regulator [Streptomyces sp. YSPA8]GLF92885.1 AraC family transcriptional regulator [Streptomyces sp. YSPA8]
MEEMDEYASAHLVALVQRALAAQGIHTVAPTSAGALLPFRAKHRFLTGVAREHGLMPLLRVGAALSAYSSDPAVSALLGSVTPHDLFERWQRLERFTHSRHRVVVRERGAVYLVAEHVGPPGAPPDPAADALVLGVLTALLALCGARDITVDAGRGGSGPVTVFSGGGFTAPPPGLDSGLWRFTWSHTAPPAAAARAQEPGQDAVSRARRLLAADPARRWTLGGLAAELGVPPRSLQRRLAGAGGFGGLLGRVRTEAAAELLMRSGHSVSVIGFACGYADQPHFTRHFKLRTAMTPAAYRSAFRQPAPGERGGPTHVPTKRRTP